jgi:periplasmic protein TonB
LTGGPGSSYKHSTKAGNSPVKTPNQPKRRRDLFFGAVVSCVALLAVVWFGNRPAGAAKPPAPAIAPTTVIPFPSDPDTSPPVEDEDTHPKAKERPTDILPQLPELPQPVRLDAITQPIEIVPPNSNLKPMLKIPPGGGGDTASKVFNLDVLDQVPVAKHQVPPAYPSQARRDGRSGDVLVDFIVYTDGNVRNAFAAHSSGRVFEEPAVEAVSKWRFRPGMKGGHAVLTHMQVPIVFSLDGDGN